MQTTCPECKTTFRLSQEQLGLRRGLVRCGQCKAVFNAYHTLLPELVTPPGTAAEPALQPIPVADDPAPPSGDNSPPGTESFLTPETVCIAEPTAVVPSQEFLQDEWPSNAQPPRTIWRPVFLASLNLLLLILLGAQLAYFLRGELANRMPSARPWLTAFCEPLGCSVPLPHGLDKRAIASSSLEHDPERVSRVRLTLLIANHAAYHQAWPWLMLTLTDLHESPVALKTFPPGVYLPAGFATDKGIGAGSEREIRLDLDLGKIDAAGYNLDLIYP